MEKQVEEESVKVGLRKEDVLCRSMWSVGWVEENLATLTCWGKLQILNIGVSFSHCRN